MNPFYRGFLTFKALRMNTVANFESLTTLYLAGQGMNLNGIQNVNFFRITGKTTAKITSQGSFLEALK